MESFLCFVLRFLSSNSKQPHAADSDEVAGALGGEKMAAAVFPSAAKYLGFSIIISSGEATGLKFPVGGLPGVFIDCLDS